MLFALFSVTLLCSISKATGNARRLLSENTANDSFGNCHCETFTKVAAEFCTDETLESENFEETCMQVQTFINTGSALFHEAVACHLDLCGKQDKQFFQDLCAEWQAGRMDAACTTASLAGHGGRRKLGPHVTRRDDLVVWPCFDADSNVVLEDGSEITIQNAKAGSWIQTCQPGVFTPVLANIDHQVDGAPMKELQFENGLSLVLTASHMVYSKGELIPAYAVQPGSIVDGKTIVAVANVTGRPANVVTLRQDIMVDGLCATWLTEEFMPVARFQFVWSMIHQHAAFFPTVVFEITQAIADFFVPLLDGGIIGHNTILAVMFSTGFLLFCTSAAMLMSFYTVLHIIFLGSRSHKF